MSIRIWVASPEDPYQMEAQTYSNYTGLSIGKIRNSLRGRVVPPSVGNFPHMAGQGKDVLILKIYRSSLEDNAGVDVSTLISEVNKL